MHHRNVTTMKRDMDRTKSQMGEGHTETGKDVTQTEKLEETHKMERRKILEPLHLGSVQSKFN